MSNHTPAPDAPTMSPLRTLVTRLYPGDLDAAVTAWRKDGTSWATIAHHIQRATDVSVTGQSARNWWGD